MIGSYAAHNKSHSGMLTIVLSAHGSADHEKFHLVGESLACMWHHSAGLLDSEKIRNGIPRDEAKSKAYSTEFATIAVRLVP